MVHIELEELWRYPIGVEITVDEQRYLYIGKDDFNTPLLYSYEKEQVVGLDALPKAVGLVSTTIALDKLIEVKLQQLLLLVADGWQESGLLDMTADLEEYKILMKIKRIHDGVE
jgi:hypothetical protein